VRSLLVLAVLAGDAVAQPVTHPEPEACKVVVALAPPAVRAEIEAWVRAEPRCECELEVRVVPTRDGYYLSARDNRGRVRERVVPDAQSAAVLVVSWMADDSLGPNFPTPVEREPAPVADHADALLEHAPPAVEPSVRRGFRIERAERAQRWLSLGAIGSAADRVGVRGQVDVFAAGAWSVAVAGGYRAGDRGPGVSQARLLLGTQRALGHRWSLRAQLGVGADVVDDGERDVMSKRDTDAPQTSTISGKLEAGVLANLRLDRSWGLVGGPLLESSTDLQPILSVYVGLVRGL